MRFGSKFRIGLYCIEKIRFALNVTVTETIQRSVVIIREALVLNGRTPWYKASIDFSVRNIKEFFANFCLEHRSNTSSESRGGGKGISRTGGVWT